ncbi:putative porin [Tibeticola sediminis]|uniref:Putative porin n=1 Tax=Tibeticola sediminis TaxID=1917811 RepID=A0A3N4UR89_9BURK|nr:porin [Tibeticola sediminis]RPE73202.1 putative porin [Tibeticola sediminis]
MKKTLIALAALAAAGASFAQSSVTLYGVADMAVGKTNKAGLGLANDKFQAIASNTLNNGTSRFGFKGVEDLGGGLKAGFNFEGGLSLADGSGNKSGGQLFSRAANMSLMGGFGEIRGGRTLTTSFYSIASWELTGTANYSVVANQFGFAGAGPRDSGVVMYNSPNFSGFSFSASTILKGNAVYGTAADPKGKYDLSATYANGPIVASFAYNKVQDGNKGYALGGKYNFGPAAVAASIQKSQTNSGTILAKGYTLGVSGNVGAVGLTFDYARDSEYKDSDYLLEAKYPLSKRTFAYAVYMRDGKGKQPEAVNGYSLGLRHNF